MKQPIGSSTIPIQSLTKQPIHTITAQIYIVTELAIDFFFFF